jgi:hypothetical protein
MTTAEVEALVQNVIVHFGLPFTVLSVVGSPIGWNVTVRSSGTERVVSLPSLASALPPFGRRSNRSWTQNSSESDHAC